MPVALDSSKAGPNQVLDPSQGQAEREVFDTEASFGSRQSNTLPDTPEDSNFQLGNGPEYRSILSATRPQDQKLLQAIAEINTLPTGERIGAIVDFLNQSGRFASLGRSMTRFDADTQNAALEQAKADILEDGVTLEEVGLLQEAERLRTDADRSTDANRDDDFDTDATLSALPEVETDLSLLGTEVFPQRNMVLAEARIPGLKLEGRFFAAEGTNLLSGDLPSPGETLLFAGVGVLENGAEFGLRGVPVVPGANIQVTPEPVASLTTSIQNRASDASSAWNDVALYSETDPTRIEDARRRVDLAIAALRKLY